MKKAFTMVELIVSIVIMGILAGGTYVSLEALYTKSAKSKAISELSFDSTLISSQILALLSYRVPSTVIGYDSNSSKFESIYNLSENYTTFEWIGVDFESYKAGNFSAFIDFSKSNRDTNMLFSPDTKMQDVNSTALMFAGVFDDGSVVYGADFNDSFGWHGNNHNFIFDINESSTDENITLLQKPSKIYEKYYLLKSAFAIARYRDIEQSATCIFDLNMSVSDKTLFLFYDYYPWKSETFCADKSGSTNGKVTILSNEVKGFEVDFINGNLQFNLTLEREIRKKGKNLKIQISKNKVVF